MDQTLSYFVYTPPKSNSHGHSVRDKNVRRATEKAIDSFVNSFNATADNKVHLTLYYDKVNQLQKAHKTIDKLSEFLGAPNREWDNIGFEHMDNTITWESSNSNILDLLDYLNGLKDESYLPFDKYSISCFYHYGKTPNPYGSTMYSINSGSLFVRLYLIFPYTIDDPKSYELLSKFQKALPFKLNSKHFRRLGPGKQGYGQWRLDEETQNRLDECLKLSIAK